MKITNKLSNKKNEQLMSTFFRITLFIFFLMSISGCKSENIRTMTSDSIKIEYNGEQCLPLESFVPPDKEITVSINNSSNFDFSWYIIIFPIEDSIELKDPENTIFSAHVPSGQKLDFEFISPKFPARYDTLCVQDLFPDKRTLKYLLVVDPNPTPRK